MIASDFHAPAEAILRALGAAAVYTTAAGAQVETWALLDRKAEAVSFESSAVERRHTVSLLASVGTPERGDTVTLNGEIWELQDLEADDGVVVKFSVVKVPA